MEAQVARKKVAEEYADVYQHAWGKYGFIKDEAARAHAVNGLMVTIDKVWPFFAPKDPAPAQETPAKAPTAAPAAQPPSKPASAAPPAQAPQKPQETPAKPASPPAAPVQKQLPDQPHQAYDRTGLHWNECPECGNEDIDYEAEKVNKRTGKPYTKKYQACFGDVDALEQHPGIFLNADGKVVPMPPRTPEV
jgi:pyruvate/2-oxoglutarate dehydrogenase complex dihydrolipoamide acyltransferase (E2) component